MPSKILARYAFFLCLSSCQCIREGANLSPDQDQNKISTNYKEKSNLNPKATSVTYAIELWERKFKTDPLYGSSLDEMIEILRLEERSSLISTEQQISDWANLWIKCSEPIQGYCLERFLEVFHVGRKDKFSSLDLLVDALTVVIEKNVSARDIENSNFKNLLNLKSILKTEHKNVLQKYLDVPAKVQEPPKWNHKWFAYVEDPWLLKSTKHVCFQKQNMDPSWVKWVDSLSGAIKLYWEAKYTKTCDPLLYQEIENKIQKAIDSLQKEEARNLSYLKLELYYDLIQIYRSLGSRMKMASAYVGLISVWKDPHLNTLFLKTVNIKFPERKIDDFLWASRALILVGEYDEAKELLAQITDLCSLEIKQKRKSDSQIFYDFLAEVAHVQSSRIFYEAGQITEAIRINKKAIEESKASSTWRNRLRWYLGLFYYAQNEVANAKDVWASLLEDLSSFDSLRPGLLYWLSRAHEELKDKQKAASYLARLNDEFPLSFYLTLNLMNLLERKVDEKQNLYLKSFFDRYDSLRDRFETQHVLKEEEFLKQGALQDLFLKYRFAVEINHSRWAMIYWRAIRKNLNVKYTDMERRLFLTRLEYESGSYASAFASMQGFMSGQKDFLEKYPEQMFLLFPLPYFKVAKDVAFRNRVPLEWLYGVSRQESSFRTEVVSPAGAVGLMQLMPATALALAQDGKFGERQIISYSQAFEELQNPDVNLEAGARLLTRLSRKYGNNEAAVFAAYNAGEYVVDRWLNKRASDDPIFWIEMIPFQETKGYVRSVMRNVFVYRAMIEYDSRKR